MCKQSFNVLFFVLFYLSEGRILCYILNKCSVVRVIRGIVTISRLFFELDGQIQPQQPNLGKGTLGTEISS